MGEAGLQVKIPLHVQTANKNAKVAGNKCNYHLQSSDTIPESRHNLNFNLLHIMDEPTPQNPFGISRDEILNLAAQKLADQYCAHEDLERQVDKLLIDRVQKAFADKIEPTVSEILVREVEKLLATEVTPVNIWGEKIDSPTTIRDALTKKAMTFWSDTVNAEGKPTNGYGARPRSEWMLGKIVNEEFTKVISQHFVNIIGALKTSLKKEAQTSVDKYFDELIRVKVS